MCPHSADAVCGHGGAVSRHGMLEGLRRALVHLLVPVRPLVLLLDTHQSPSQFGHGENLLFFDGKCLANSSTYIYYKCDKSTDYFPLLIPRHELNS